MKIKEIEITNFRGINGKGAKFILSDNLNVFVGVNGSGKTTILDAIVTSLSWLVNRIQRENSSGRPIPESSIRSGFSYSSIGIIANEKNKSYSWKIVKTAKGFPIGKVSKLVSRMPPLKKPNSELAEVSELASYFQNIFQNNSSLPVVVYYPINRVVENGSPKISGKESLNILDVYDNALGGKTNYQSFFEWFRLQDDIVNEQAQSRSKWIVKNKKWIKSRTIKLLSFLKSTTKGNDYDYDNIEINRFVDRFKRDDVIYENPRFLFHEMSDLLHTAEFKYRRTHKFGDVFHDVDYLFHRMGSLSDSKMDNVIEPSKFPTKAIDRITKQIIDIQYHSKHDDDTNTMISFIWEALLFSVLISLWWLSDKGKKELENLFVEFNPNKNKDETKLKNEYEKFSISINKIVQSDAERLDKATRSEGRELKYVTRTIENFVPGYSNLRVKRAPRPQMLVDKDGETISLDQLSDGEKNLIALVGDIARRLCIANSNSSKPLAGEGIILIDEIDLHLHPSWQRLMIPKLTELFPNCQFFITTHSPQVLSHVHSQNIFLLKNEKNVFSYSKAIESYGQNSDRILEDLLGVDARPSKEKEMLHELFALIQKGELEKAKKKVDILSKLIEGRDPEIVKAEVLIKRKEIIGK